MFYTPEVHKRGMEADVHAVVYTRCLRTLFRQRGKGFFAGLAPQDPEAMFIMYDRCVFGGDFADYLAEHGM